MAELTVLESKLGEVMGLAMAAQGATEKVAKLVEEEGDDDLVRYSNGCTRRRPRPRSVASSVAGEFDGKKTAILEKAREVKREATEMMRTYLGDDADALDGFEFLTMAEAGEVGHWSIVEVLAQRARDARTLDARRVGEADPGASLRSEVKKARSKLAKGEDPNAVE